MARAIPLPMIDLDIADRARRLKWSGGVSLTTRILAVNIIALGLTAGSLFYLDSYRKQLLAERFSLARAEAEITADALVGQPVQVRRALLTRIGSEQHFRLRLYDADGRLVADSFKLAPPTYALLNPDKQSWLPHVARALDRGMDFVLGAPPIQDYRPDYRDAETASSAAWPELAEVRTSCVTALRQRLAPDRTPVITAAACVGARGEALLTTRNATDFTQKVRDARQTLAIIVGVALLISIQLSLFLARTIVEPLRILVRAAVRVRRGRDRAVIVPRLPERRDEIGLLARAISDMTNALRLRIDAVESFAADVSHEIKNPLASLRSALESLDKVEDPALRKQLSAIAAHDVQRIDRLVTEIADASRIDAQLSRTTFEAVDIATRAKALVGAREQRGIGNGLKIRITTGKPSDALVSGDAARLERVLENLLDNAISFSPPGGVIELAISRNDDRLEIAVSDSGPGIPPETREKIFERFHSLRPADEDFGSHSGLGLAIARTIVEAHDGTLTAQDRSDGRGGARLVIDLPAWSEPEE
jgi:two-component system sensor histidine kinase ChvG